MRISDYIPADPSEDEWDVIVVGTGMGGGTAGYELARRGRRVLFLEKGKFLHGGPGAVLQPDPNRKPEQEMRLMTGRWPHPIRGRTSFGDVEFYAPLGCGTAGTTGLYGSQLERFQPIDFEPLQHFKDIPGAEVPEAWPVGYDEMLPYYRRAEALYRVRGTQDPLNPDPDAMLLRPPELSERDAALHEAFESRGLHPYRSHVGFQYLPECFECADVCPIGCKSDAAGVSVIPALVKFDARLIPECEVVEILATRNQVSGVRVIWKGRESTISARTIVLAAGAYMTPLLLMNSKSSEWPEGLANRNGVVGRYLMLHASDFVAISPRTWHSPDGPEKSIALNDFYVDGGMKLGTLQSVGLKLEPAFIQAYLQYVWERDPRWWRSPSSVFIPPVARWAPRVFARASLFATIVEDLPYAENRIVADADSVNGMRFEYRYTDDLMRRNRHFRKRIRETLSPDHSVRVVTGGRNNINYGHVCGTCRFGDDPTTSALDRDNRAHEIDNLFVVDASFFPSSSGTNPSMTIAANALRVGEVVHQSLA